MTPEQFAEIMRVIRETVRAEMRAEFEGRRGVRDRHALGHSEIAKLQAAAASNAAFNPHGVEV